LPKHKSRHQSDSDKKSPDDVFASETHKKRGIWSGLARECEPNKENLRGQARSYAPLLKQRHHQEKSSVVHSGRSQ
jgi:hypothetical protein